MRYRFPLQLAICASLIFAFAGALWAQGNAQSDLSTVQRLDVMRSKLEAMHRSLSSAISSMGPAPSEKEKKKLEGGGNRKRRQRKKKEGKGSRTTGGERTRRRRRKEERKKEGKKEKKKERREEQKQQRN